MNKEELIERVNALPLFEKRQVKNETAPGSDEWRLDERNNSIVEIGGKDVVVYVGKRYHLLQFKEVFLPILKNIEDDVEGWVIHNGGYASLVMFPESEDLKDGKMKYGLVAANSVDCSSAVVVKFCVEHNGRRVTIRQKLLD